MTCDYSFTFEFDTQAPVTVQGTVSAGQLRTIAARAIDDAVKAHPGLVWRSVVLVVERRARSEHDAHEASHAAV